LYAESAAAAVRAGISRIRESPRVVAETGEPLRCAVDQKLEKVGPGWVRMAALAATSLREVVAKLPNERSQVAHLSVLLAVPEARPGFGLLEQNSLMKHIQGEEFPGVMSLSVELVSGGHAGVVQALETASQRISRRELDLCVVGGVDSYFDPATLRWLESNRRLLRNGIRGGFAPGEAAGMVAMASGGECARRRVPSLARLRGIAVAREPRKIDSDEGLLGEGLTEVVARVTEGLRLPDESIDDLYCDINGERHRTEEWGFTALRLPHAFKDAAAYQSGAGSWGDVGAASAALSCVLAVQAWRRQYAGGPRALVWGSSPLGLRGAVVLEQGEA
jgi:3-oxoacyl-[acyl-carrier-protein] synthase-1